MPDSNRTLDDEGLRELLTEAVREAGALALSKFRTTYKSWTKGKSSPVSEVDIAVDDLLRERLAASVPGYGWLSEETADAPERLNARRVWIVDPIDGTRGFIAGEPDWTVVAALVENGRPILSAVSAPVENKLFVAQAGRGATLNGAPLRLTSGSALSGLRIAGPARRQQALANLLPGAVLQPKVHSLALRLIRVAEGIVDVALAGPNANDWDLAAADLLVHEAGGVLTTLAGRPVVYNRAKPVHEALIAADRERHPALINLLRDRLDRFP